MEKIFKLDEIEQIAEGILIEARKNKSKRANVIALYGDLGAGKTTTTKEIAKQLGIKNNVISPTFVIMKKYQTQDVDFKNLIHIDAYRLEKKEELDVLGWQELIENKYNLVIIEWPEKVPGSLPNDVLNVSLDHKDETTRNIKFWYNI